MKREDDSLTIFGVAERDQGSYTCFASTELDQDLAKAYLTVLGNCCLPTAPPPLHGPASRPRASCSQRSCAPWMGLRVTPVASRPVRRGDVLPLGLRVRKLLLSEQAGLGDFTAE